MRSVKLVKTAQNDWRDIWRPKVAMYSQLLHFLVIIVMIIYCCGGVNNFSDSVYYYYYCPYYYDKDYNYDYDYVANCVSYIYPR